MKKVERTRCIWPNCSDDSDSSKNCDDYSEAEKANIPVCNLAGPHCFNVNAWNVSIEKWEYLPLYRWIVNEKAEDHPYVYNEDWNPDETCNGWEVEMSNMKCTYTILDPNNNKVHEETLPCFGKDGAPQPKKIVQNWIDWQMKEYGISFADKNRKKFQLNFGLTKSDQWKLNGHEIDDLWEYKVQITKVTYYQCMEDWWTKNEKEAVCASNFILTEPYTVQKTPSWNLKASTSTLEKFKSAEGASVADFSKYISAMSVSDYYRNSKVDKAMESFKDKYEKLAVAVKGGSKIKKVPGKNIYFINEDFTIKDGTFNKAFTIVQKGENKVTIDWSVENLNMMILTDWTIEFKWNCTSDQTVKWIFVWKTLSRGGSVKKNTNPEPSYNYWCNKWWLHIKWVLIGDNFGGLMEGSRSHIDGWRKNETDRNPDDELKTKVMNWASVVIEYSPSIFTQSTMPPGAEYFTTALDIYKK